MSGCENRLFLILALCVSGRLIPLAESGRKRVRNQKKIEFRTPGRPHGPSPAYRSPAVQFMICFFLEGIPSIILCNLSNNTKARLYHCLLARNRLKSRIIYFNWRIHLQFSCIIDSFYAKVLTLNAEFHFRIILISAFQIIFWLFWYLAYLPAYYYWGTNMSWKVGSFTIPTNWFDACNALFCIISGPLTAMLWHKLESRPQGDISLFKKLGIALGFLGCGYIFYAIVDIARGSGKPSCLLLIIFLVFLTLGEMFFSPLGSAFIAEYSPSRLMAIMMSVWSLGIFFAAKLYAYVYQFAFGGHFKFTHACIGVAIAAFLCTVILFAMDKPLRSLVEKKEDQAEA